MEIRSSTLEICTAKARAMENAENPPGIISSSVTATARDSSQCWRCRKLQRNRYLSDYLISYIHYIYIIYVYIYNIYMIYYIYIWSTMYIYICIYDLLYIYIDIHIIWCTLSSHVWGFGSVPALFEVLSVWSAKPWANGRWYDASPYFNLPLAICKRFPKCVEGGHLLSFRLLSTLGQKAFMGVVWLYIYIWWGPQIYTYIIYIYKFTHIYIYMIYLYIILSLSIHVRTDIQSNI